MRHALLTIGIIALFVAFTGCSGVSSTPAAPSNADLPQGLNSQSEFSVLYSGTFEIDLETLSILQHEDRSSDFVYNITGFLPDKCPGGCFRFRIVGVVGTVLQIELTIENPLNIQVHDVRLSYINLYGKTVVNPDSYTDFLGAPVSNIFPFTAFAKEYTNRAFPVGPGGIDTETLFLDFPPGAFAAVSYAITASEGGNTQEPYEISGMMQSGQLTPSGGNATISCRVDDHQGDVTDVLLDANQITGSVESMTENPGNPGLFEVQISNAMGAPIGTYTCLIKAFSPNAQNISTYNYIQIIVSEESSDVIYVDDSYSGTDSDGTMVRPFTTIMNGMNAALPGWQVWVDDSGLDYSERVSVFENVTLKSVNWDPSDGGDMASIYYTSGSVVSLSSDYGEIDGFKIYGSSDTGVTISGNNCTMRNCWITEIIKTADSGIVEGTRVSYCDGTLITDCEYSNLQLNAESGIIDCIYNNRGTNVTIQRCKIHNFRRNTESGILIPIYFNTCDGVTLRNNLIYDIVSSSSSITSGVYFNTTTNSLVENNTLTGFVNGDGGTAGGIAVDDESFNWHGRNNIVYGYIGYGVYIWEPGAVWEYNNVNTTEPGYAPVGVGNIVEDPMFVDEMNYDFHLDIGSPCIDTGDPTVMDWDSTRSDMGAYGGPMGNW